MLDVGTGSGILLIAARLLGVREGWAVDTDERVGPEVRRNLALSGFSEDVRFLLGTPADVAGEFGLVVANITAPVLTEFAADLRRLTSPGGHLILSGMLAGEAEAVLTAIERSGWDKFATLETEGWVAAWLKRPV
jgi:ribosomal protein L11 methyltransferase